MLRFGSQQARSSPDHTIMARLDGEKEDMPTTPRFTMDSLCAARDRGYLRPSSSPPTMAARGQEERLMLRTNLSPSAGVDSGTRRLRVEITTNRQQLFFDPPGAFSGVFHQQHVQSRTLHDAVSLSDASPSSRKLFG